MEEQRVSRLRRPLFLCVCHFVTRDFLLVVSELLKKRLPHPPDSMPSATLQRPQLLKPWLSSRKLWQKQQKQPQVLRVKP
jgi:hypothetical protein